MFKPGDLVIVLRNDVEAKSPDFLSEIHFNLLLKGSIIEIYDVFYDDAYDRRGTISYKLNSKKFNYIPINDVKLFKLHKIKKILNWLNK